MKYKYNIVLPKETLQTVKREKIENKGGLKNKIVLIL